MHVYVCCCLVGLGQAITPMACVRPCTHVFCCCCVGLGSAFPSTSGVETCHFDRARPDRGPVVAAARSEQRQGDDPAGEDDTSADEVRCGRAHYHVARAKSGATYVRVVWPVSGSCMYLILDILQSYSSCVAVLVCSGQEQGALVLQDVLTHHRVPVNGAVSESRRRISRAWSVPSAQTPNLNTQMLMSQVCLLVRFTC